MKILRYFHQANKALLFQLNDCSGREMGESARRRISYSELLSKTHYFLSQEPLGSWQKLLLTSPASQQKMDNEVQLKMGQSSSFHISSYLEKTTRN